MASDIKLNGNGVLVEGTDVTFDRGAEQSSIALNLKNPKGFWHISGPRSYEPNNPLSIFWHNNTQFSGPFLSVTTNGNVGIGISNPTNKLHVFGNGPVTIENPSGEADILFKSGNNPSWQVGTNNEGWYVWDNAYRLVVKPGGSVEVKGKLFVDEDLFVNGTIRGTIRVDGTLLGRDMGPSKKTNAIQCEANAIQLAPNASDSNAHFALFHELNSKLDKDLLIVNYEAGYKQGVKIEGNVQVTGVLTQASSIALKENVAELLGQEAMAALQGLNAVKFNYKADSQKQQCIGFIAEEVPDLVASAEHDRLSPMDIVAVLTKAMQEQQKMLAELAAEVSALRGQGS